MTMSDMAVSHDEVTPGVAYSISRKVGNAVTRNRIRRRLRAAVEEYVGQHGAAFSAAVLIVSPGAADQPYEALRGQVVEIMKKIEKSTDVTA